MKRNNFWNILPVLAVSLLPRETFADLGTVKNFNLTFGDQSIHAHFSPPDTTDLDHYDVYFSYNLSTLATVGQAVQSASSTITLTSPISFPAKGFAGDAAIAPVINYQPVYVMVQTVNSSGQIVGNNLAYLQATAMPTGPGQPDSCSLSSTSASSERALPSIAFVSINFLFALLCFGLKRASLRSSESNPKV